MATAQPQTRGTVLRIAKIVIIAIIVVVVIALLFATWLAYLLVTGFKALLPAPFDATMAEVSNDTIRVTGLMAREALLPDLFAYVSNRFVPVITVNASGADVNATIAVTMLGEVPVFALAATESKDVSGVLTEEDNGYVVHIMKLNVSGEERLVMVAMRNYTGYVAPLEYIGEYDGVHVWGFATLEGLNVTELGIKAAHRVCGLEDHTVRLMVVGHGVIRALLLSGYVTVLSVENQYIDSEDKCSDTYILRNETLAFRGAEVGTIHVEAGGSKTVIMGEFEDYMVVADNFAVGPHVHAILRLVNISGTPEIRIKVG